MYNYYVMYLIYDYFHFSKKNNNLDIFIYLVAEKQTFLNDCFSFGALSFFAYPHSKGKRSFVSHASLQQDVSTSAG